jgi:hypothetical protein
MTLLTAYIWFGTLVALVFYIGMVKDGCVETWEWLGLLIFALVVGALWPVTCLTCVWGEARA